jgi:hypothetical protein
MNPCRYNPTGVSMWMKNGERLYARWLPKDHAIELAANRAISRKAIL